MKPEGKCFQWPLNAIIDFIDYRLDKYNIVNGTSCLRWTRCRSTQEFPINIIYYNCVVEIKAIYI